MLNVKEQSVLLLSKSFESDAYLDEPARLIIRFSSDSVFVKLMQNMAKWGHWQHHMKHAKWQKRGQKRGQNEKLSVAMYYIPHICQQYHQYICREICHVEIFLNVTDMEKSEVSPHMEKFLISPHHRCGQIWNFSTSCMCVMWRMSPHKCKIYSVLLYNRFCHNLRCFVAKYVLLRFAHFCVEKI